MKNKKIILGVTTFLFIMMGICSISHTFTDEFDLSHLSYRAYGLGNLNDGDIIEINEVDSSGAINVYIMNDEQYDEVVDSGGLIWNYFIRWKDITYLSGLTFDITIDDYYYIVFYNKNLIFKRTVRIDISIEYEPKSISITSPTSTDIFLPGYNYITWATTGDIDYVKIGLYKGGSFMEIITDYTINDGLFSWYIYNDEYVDGLDYQICINDYYDFSAYDFSEYFTIKTETEKKTITITSPTTGDILSSGNQHITWTSTGDIDYVQIELYKFGSSLETITSYTVNDGTYTWHIYDNEYIDGSYYQIRISDCYDDSIYDYSDYFTIEDNLYVPPDEPDVPPDKSENQYWILLLIYIMVPVVVISSIIATIVIVQRRKKNREDVIEKIK